MEPYDHSKIEKKWQKYWQENGIYKVLEAGDKKRFYVLDMFPYPSGAGLHVGHPRGYIATDVYSRYHRMNGYNVLHPMGWDAFGLPAENYAIKNKVHPSEAVARNVARYKEQLSNIGFDYAWDHEVNTTDPDFYKWTQWQFLQFLKAGLAYQSHEPINWCPSCQTGLANEDLESDGTCERCGSQVEQRKMRQWMLRITDYADRLLDDIETLEEWPESVKESQRNWIGRSQGAEITFSVRAGELSHELKVFTTRPDTLFGATYMVVAPEHPLIHTFESAITNLEEVKTYVRAAMNKSDIERTAEGKEKTGVRLEGVVAVNPANQEEIPVFVADYVLGHYGTGAIMAVPAHDERDFAFAQKYKIKIKSVIELPQEPSVEYRQVVRGSSVGNFVGFPKVFQVTDLTTGEILGFRYENLGQVCHTCVGSLLSSGKFTGMNSDEAKHKITEAVGGKMTNTYRLNDWVFSRQRYWGEPIPVVHAEDGTVYPVAEADLPVLLPEVESYEPTGTGESPLAAIDDWVNVTGYINETGEFVVATEAPQGKELQVFKRETNTMPNWAGSSWYYIRYVDPQNTQQFVSKEAQEKWLPVDMYVGGVEHATRHLIYARFWHKFLYDQGYVTSTEPFMRLRNQGLIQAEDGRKMSKRWGNVINPDDVVDKLGADALRLYEMFIAPFENSTPWSTDGLVGTRRFIEKVWKFSIETIEQEWKESDARLERALHKAVKKITFDIENFKFNTAVSTMMVFMNEALKTPNELRGSKISSERKIGEMQQDLYTSLSLNDLKIFLKILAPFAPHVTEELWHQLGHETSIHLESWPEYDEALVVDDEVTIGVQVNGKVRAEVLIRVDAPEGEARGKAMAAVGDKWLDGKEIKKFVYVPGRIISIVV